MRAAHSGNYEAINPGKYRVVPRGTYGIDNCDPQAFEDLSQWEDAQNELLAARLKLQGLEEEVCLKTHWDDDSRCASPTCLRDDEGHDESDSEDGLDTNDDDALDASSDDELVEEHDKAEPKRDTWKDIRTRVEKEQAERRRKYFSVRRFILHRATCADRPLP